MSPGPFSPMRENTIGDQQAAPCAGPPLAPAIPREDREQADSSRAQAPDGQLASLPLALQSGADCRMELVLRPESRTPGLYPFVTLGANGRYARAHLARVVTRDGRILRHLALKVQRDRYDVETDRGNVLTNAEIAGLFEREYGRLRALGEQADSPAAEVLAAAEALPVLPPVIYCRERQVFFHPPCPGCGRGLRDCEDPSVLTRRELPRHSQSNIRYLYCASCHEKDPQAPLYRFQAGERERKAGVRDWKSLCEDWSSLCEEGRGPGRETGDRRDRKPETAFPCQGCPSSGECYRKDGEDSATAAQRLAPLSLFDFRAIPLEALRLHYDEFADCLGGMRWSDFLSEHRGNREGIPEQVFLSDLRAQLDRPDRFLFAGGLEAVEVFRLKLALFTQLCRRVMDFHRVFRAPHLDLKPENAMVEVPPVSRELPYLWNFRVKLIDLAAATEFACGEDGAARTIPSPPLNYSELYTAPIVRQGQFGHLKPCDIQFRGSEDLGDGRHRLTARLRSPDLIAGDYSDKDVFRISVNQAEVGEPLAFWAAKVAAADVPPGAMEVAGDPLKLRPGTGASLQYLGSQWLRNVHFETYHAFGVPCDLYSLGVIFLRTLLCGKRQNMAVVATKVMQPLLNELRRIHDEAAGREGDGRGASGSPAGSGELAARVRQFLAQNPCVRSQFVYWDGDPARESAISPDLWQDALLLAVRLCTSLPGFSYASGRGDFDPQRPERAMEAVVSDLESLGARVHSALFGREEMNREVAEAIARARAKLAGRPRVEARG